MVDLARRTEAVERSKIRMMMDIAAKESGLVRLEVGEPDFTTPRHIIDAAAEAAVGGATHYTSDAGLLELREAIASKMAEENDVTVDPESEIAVTTGGNEAVHLALLATVDPGDEIVIPKPAWPNYATHAAAVGATVVDVPLSSDDGFALDPEAVAAAITNDTAAVILSTPSNPTGRVYDPADIRAVVETAADHEAFVLADEVYESLIFEGDRRGIASIAPSERVITINSFSKRYAMTGWRVGWLAGAPDVVGAARTFHQSSTSCAPIVSQNAALAALEGPQEPVREMRDAYRRRRDYVVDRLREMPRLSVHPPEGGFYAFPDVREIDSTSFDIATELVTEYGVVTVPGSGFGDAGEGHLRLSFATGLDQLELGMDRLEEMATDR